MSGPPFLESFVVQRASARPRHNELGERQSCRPFRRSTIAAPSRLSGVRWAARGRCGPETTNFYALRNGPRSTRRLAERLQMGGTAGAEAQNSIPRRGFRCSLPWAAYVMTVWC